MNPASPNLSAPFELMSFASPPADEPVVYDDAVVADYDDAADADDPADDDYAEEVDEDAETDADEDADMASAVPPPVDVAPVDLPAGLPSLPPVAVVAPLVIPPAPASAPPSELEVLRKELEDQKERARQAENKQKEAEVKQQAAERKLEAKLNRFVFNIPQQQQTNYDRCLSTIESIETSCTYLLDCSREDYGMLKDDTFVLPEKPRTVTNLEAPITKNISLLHQKLNDFKIKVLPSMRKYIKYIGEKNYVYGATKNKVDYLARQHAEEARERAAIARIKETSSRRLEEN